MLIGAPVINHINLCFLKFDQSAHFISHSTLVRFTIVSVNCVAAGIEF
jgi:hypothetical protein